VHRLNNCPYTGPKEEWKTFFLHHREKLFALKRFNDVTGEDIYTLTESMVIA
jgi:hypothetical protein